MPNFIDSMEHHGHLSLDARVRELLLAMSAATMDRVLAPKREPSNGRKRRRRRTTVVGRKVPVRTFADWGDPAPGFFEGDFVVHCGGSMSGSVVHTLVLTDIATAWTECIPLAVREQSLVVEALRIVRTRLPFEMLGFDTDNDGAFINETVFEYCAESGIEFTRSANLSEVLGPC